MESESLLTSSPTMKLHLKCFTAIEILHLAWLAEDLQLLHGLNNFRKPLFAHQQQLPMINLLYPNSLNLQHSRSSQLHQHGGDKQLYSLHPR